MNSMDDLMKMAQKIASQIPKPDGENRSNDMQGMVKHVTESVMTMMQSGEMDLNKMTSSLMGGINPELLKGLQGSDQEFKRPQPISNSKIKLDVEESDNIPTPHSTMNIDQYKLKHPKLNETSYEELDDDEEVDELQPRTKDIILNLNITLEEFYKGVKKKLAVNRNRLHKNPNTGELVSMKERKKISIPITPGMRDGQTLRFNKEGNEEIGYETGDIVVQLYEDAHPDFERDGDNLFYIKEISLYETFLSHLTQKTKLFIPHLDGTILQLEMEKPLTNITNSVVRKISGGGMPIYKKDTYGDMFIRFVLQLPDSIDKQGLDTLKNLFPPLEQPSRKSKIVRTMKVEEISKEDIIKLDSVYSDGEYTNSDLSDDDDDEDDDYEDDEDDDEIEEENPNKNRKNDNN